MKIAKRKQESQNSSSSSPEALLPVPAPMYNAFGVAMRKAESFGAKHLTVREFWEAVLPAEEMPATAGLNMLSVRIGYELLRLDHIIAGVELPEKAQKNLEAARKYDMSAMDRGMRSLMEVAEEQRTEKGDMEMTKQKGSKTTRQGVAHVYLEIFSKQKEANLTDEQIADIVEKKTGSKPTSKNVASYRCHYNQGKLEGQKTSPKEKVKAVRPKSDKPKVKKPMSEETKAKLKAYSQNKKLKIKTKK